MKTEKGLNLTENLLIENYNKLAQKVKSAPECHIVDLLKSFSDFDLFVFIAGKTYQHGRSFKDSIVNAKIHLKNKSNAIQLFSN